MSTRKLSPKISELVNELWKKNVNDLNDINNSKLIKFICFN